MEPVPEFFNLLGKLNSALTASVRPLFLKDEGERRLAPLGSCVLVSLDGVKFVFTAGHVLSEPGYPNQFNRGTIALASAGGRLIPLSSREAVFMGRKTNSQDLDVGVVRMEQTNVELDKCHFLAEGEWQFEHEDDRSGKSLYVLVGYPGSRGLTKIRNLQIEQRSLCICTNLAPEERYEELNLPVKDHILLEYNQNKVKHNGARFNMWKLGGMSGGGVFRVQKDTGRAQLVAILTEHRTVSTCIVATRVNHAITLAAIYKGIPGLPELLRMRPEPSKQA
jgi:hypothetical protein